MKKGERLPGPKSHQAPQKEPLPPKLMPERQQHRRHLKQQPPQPKPPLKCMDPDRNRAGSTMAALHHGPVRAGDGGGARVKALGGVVTRQAGGRGVLRGRAPARERRGANARAVRARFVARAAYWPGLLWV